MEFLHFTSTFEFTFFGVCNPLCEFCVCICVCLYFIFVCSVQKSYRATRHQWQFPQFAAAAFKFNSTSIQTHVVAATIQRITEYRIWRNTESEEYLQTRERAMKQSTVIIKFNLTSIWCHVAVLRTKTRYRISNHVYCENQSVVLQSSRIPRRRTKDEARHQSLHRSPPLLRMQRRCCGRFSIVQIWNREYKIQKHAQNAQLYKSKIRVWKFTLARLTSLFKTTCWGN